MSAMEMAGNGKHARGSICFLPFHLSSEIALRFPHSHRRDHGGPISSRHSAYRSIEHEL